MKRRELMKRLQRLAKERGQPLLTREGGSHTVVRIGHYQTVVPRHSEIDDLLARKILRQLGE